MAPPGTPCKRPATLGAYKVMYYFVTLKCNKIGYTSIEQLYNKLRETMNKTNNMEWSDHVVYELDSLKRLHLHTYVSCTKKPYFKKLQIKGWTVHFSQCGETDVPKVIRYMCKHKQNKDSLFQMEIESYYKFKYGFILDITS